MFAIIEAEQHCRIATGRDHSIGDGVFSDLVTSQQRGALQGRHAIFPIGQVGCSPVRLLNRNGVGERPDLPSAFLAIVAVANHTGNRCADGLNDDLATHAVDRRRGSKCFIHLLLTSGRSRHQRRTLQFVSDRETAEPGAVGSISHVIRVNLPPCFARKRGYALFFLPESIFFIQGCLQVHECRHLALGELVNPAVVNQPNRHRVEKVHFLPLNGRPATGALSALIRLHDGGHPFGGCRHSKATRRLAEGRLHQTNLWR